MTKYRNKMTHWNALEESWPKQKISELDRNREKIASSHQRVRGLSGLTKGGELFKASRNEKFNVQQKLLMYLVAALLVVDVIATLRS